MTGTDILHLHLKPIWVTLFLCIFLSIPYTSLSQYLRKDWDYDYGGDRWEECNSFIETSTGNYVMAGYTGSNASGDISDLTFDMFPSPDKGDFWVLMTDANGVKIDDRRFGGDRLDRLWSIEETSDGGFIMGGWSRSNVSGTKTEPSFGEFDYWIIKIDQNLNYVWDRTYGGNADDVLFELIQTSDDGYLAVGTSNSDISGTKSEGHYGQNDLWIVKMDSNGDFKWENTIGGVEEERVNAVFEEADGNYVVAGACESPADGIDILEPRIGGKDFWVIKIDSSDGSKFWEKRYGGLDEDEIQSMVPVSTGGYLMVGGSRSPANPPMKNDDSQMVDIWAVKVDDSGDVIEWERTLGGAAFDNCYSVKENTVGSFILGGYSQSDLSPTKTSPNKGPVGTADFWINYLSPAGDQVWDQAFGGPESDVLEDIFQTSDGGYILAGHSRTDVGGDKTDPTEGLNDFWIVKTLCDVNVEFNDTIVCPNTDFILDATDPNCVLCEWVWEDSSTDSIRHLNINAPQAYAVTLTDGVGCRRSDALFVQVQNVEAIDLGIDQEVCAGDSVEIGVGPEPLFTYQWNTNDQHPAIFIDSTGNYKLSVTDPNGCIVEDSLNLIVRPVPIVNLGNDTAICQGDTITLDAGAGFTSYTWKPIGNTQTLSFSPIGPISLGVEVENQYQCLATDEIEITAVYAVPEVSNISTDCNADNTNYTLTFDLSNNAPSEVSLQGITGAWNGTTFTSDPIPVGNLYNFYLENLNNCTSAIQTGSGGCVCLTDAGQIDNQEFNLCEGENDNVVFSGIFMDGNDYMEFILYEGSPTVINNILYTYTSNEIFNPGNIVLGQTYYIAIRIGNDNGNTVNLNDACLAISDGVPVVFNENPTPVLNLIGAQQLDCTNSSLPLDGTASIGNGSLDYFWFTALGNIMDSPTLPQVEVDEMGWYILAITDQNGCTGIDSVFVDQEEDIPEIVLNVPDTLTCDNQSIMMSSAGSSSGTIFAMEWVGPNIDGQVSSQVEVTATGNYSLIITNINTGCEEEATFEVVGNYAAPAVDAGSSPELSCATNQANLSGNFVANCDNCDYFWSSSEGAIVQGTSQLDPVIEGVGWYYLNAENLTTGCVTVDSVLVIENTNIPTDIFLDVEGPPCFEDEHGSVLIDQVSGGTAPYFYSLDGIIFQDNNDFELLAPGTYNLFVTDELGCSTTASFEVPMPEIVGVFLENDFSIDLGESIVLNPIMTDNVTEVIWSGAGTENCPNCPLQNLTPIERTEYLVTVTDENGCVATDRILVDVKDDISPYIPNAFSPNNDGNNDRFFPIFSSRYIDEIESFIVVNRWGGVVWKEANISPQELIGWDGSFRGKKVNPDVFLYSLKVRLINGESRNFSGDVTLFR